jgi:hypothetical protein
LFREAAGVELDIMPAGVTSMVLRCAELAIMTTKELLQPAARVQQVASPPR